MREAYAYENAEIQLVMSKFRFDTSLVQDWSLGTTAFAKYKKNSVLTLVLLDRTSVLD